MIVVIAQHTLLNYIVSKASMMNSIPKLSLFFLTTTMLAACSDGHDGSAHETHSSDHVATQDAMSNLKTESVDIKIESDKANETTRATRSADAHTHGDAELAIVFENNMLTIELDTPVYNILGFEHAPETDIQKAAFKKAELDLGRGDTLFTLNNQANCTSLSNDVTVALFDTDMHDEESHDEKDDHHHEHKETHDKDEHQDEAHADEHDEDKHTDVVLSYEFKCQNPEKLSNLRINLFEFFEKLSEIDATILGPSTQKQVTLTRNQSQLDIPQ